MKRRSVVANALGRRQCIDLRSPFSYITNTKEGRTDDDDDHLTLWWSGLWRPFQSCWKITSAWLSRCIDSAQVSIHSAAQKFCTFCTADYLSHQLLLVLTHCWGQLSKASPFRPLRYTDQSAASQGWRPLGETCLRSHFLPFWLQRQAHSPSRSIVLLDAPVPIMFRCSRICPKFLQDVQKWLPVTLVKYKLRSSNPFQNAKVTSEDHRQSAAESRQKLRVLTT